MESRVEDRTDPAPAALPDGGRPAALPRASRSTDSPEGSGRPAAFFDLDKTVIARSSTLAFSRSFYHGGLITRRSVLRSAYAQFVFRLGAVDHDQMERMRRYLSAQAAGWDVQTVKDIVADTLHHIVDPLVYEEAVSLIAWHHDEGREVVIVSTSGAEVVEPIGEMLGADRVIATRMVQEGGRYTGEIEFYAYAENKAEAIRLLAAERGYDLGASYGYSDSSTDLPMLEAVGRPHAVNPDRLLRRTAVERGWPVLDFSRPVQLRRRTPFETRRTTVAAVAIGAGAAAAGGVVLASRRARRAARATA
jgi:HAD superfamily hydrolase (TIGR01490 family)